MTQPIGPFTVHRSADQPAGDDQSTAPAGGAPPVSDLAQRARSYALVDAFFASVGASKPPDCSFDSDHDFERCGNGAPITSPVLFRRQPADTERVDVHDVRQGRAGDCALMATLAALTSTPEGRAVIENAIVENKNAQGDVVSYTVTLHKPESSWWPFGPKTFSAVTVTVDGGYIDGHANARGDHDWKPLEGPHEVWPLVIEKAYAAVRGGYNETCRGDVPFRAMEVLTGKPAQQRSLWPFGPSAAQIAADVAAGKLVVFDTKKSGELAHDLVNEHAYQVSGTEVHDGKLCFTLHNPWNQSEPQYVPVDELTKWFVAVDVGSVR